jgi:hypothetical protein
MPLFFYIKVPGTSAGDLAFDDATVLASENTPEIRELFLEELCKKNQDGLVYVTRMEEYATAKMEYRFTRKNALGCTL